MPHLVDIHVPARKSGIPEGEYLDEGLAKWGRPEVALAIADRGMDVVFSRGFDAYDHESGLVQILRPRIERFGDGFAVHAREDHIAIAGVGAIRNVSQPLFHALRELNDPVVRSTTRDKVMTDSILDTLGLAKQYAPVGPGETIGDALSAIDAPKVVSKPRHGMRSRDIQIGSKEEILAWHQENGGEGDWIIEEWVDLTAPIPLKGLRADDQEKIDLVNRERLPKEVRIYTFGRDDNGNLLTNCVVRASHSGDTFLNHDDWVIVDQDSVPAEILEGSDRVVRAMEAYTGVREMHLGIDWPYALTHDASDPRWLPMEVNSGEPQLVYESDHVDTARLQAGLLADQLFRIAVRGGTR